MHLRGIKEARLKGKRVLVRVDFDVVVKNGLPEDDFRIKENLPTIKYILKNGGLVRIMTHLGRPKGKIVQSLSMRKFVERLQDLLGRKVIFIQDPFNKDLFKKYDFSRDIVLFENIRFWPGEESNNFIFAKQLARWGDVYVNEAFADSHRTHASIISLPKILPPYAGFRLEKEIIALSRFLKNPPKPFIAIMGGAKLETKMPLVEKFLQSADYLLIAGALANTVYYLKGLEIGKSTADRNFKRDSVVFKNKKIILPRDFLVADKINPALFVGGCTLARSTADKRCGVKVGAKHRISEVIKVGKNEYIVDIGPKSVKLFLRLLKGAKTIVWNGPLGFTEIPEFSKGTIALAKALRKIKAFKVVGGGDTVAALQKYNLLKGFNHVSTGGGAMLEFLAGNKLPGIEVLKKIDSGNGVFKNVEISQREVLTH